jgi:hypothetical protein
MLDIALNAAPTLVYHFNSLQLISVTMLFPSGGQFVGEMRFAYIIIRLKLIYLLPYASHSTTLQ